ncbi:MAG: hypothetical protein RMI89_11715 [Gloeomargarita sp. SKYBB_i_bin120]|nr:hypothetical protein [Gloeomargarita sp. SKYB120]MDW8179179.1 hypothetical protein [Gloeomargarita sp. SKYBB_i_bin120]
MSFPNAQGSGLGCRYCRHYTPEGRRGGQCHLLGVEVQGDWVACRFALPPFAPSWERAEDWSGSLVAGEMMGLVSVRSPWHRSVEPAVR